MISRYTYHGLTWVDLESPTREEILHLAEEFSLPNLVGEEMFTSTMRSKVDLYDDFIYLILHFPSIDKESEERVDQEIDFLIGKNFLITVRYELIDPVHEFSKLFEVNSVFDREKMSKHAGFIFMEMMKEFYKRSLQELEETTLTIRHIERKIFSGSEEAMVKEISQVSRRLLDFKQAIRFHRDILNSYESASKRFFGDEYGYYASVITSEFNKVNSVLESHRDTLAELQRTNDSLLTTKSNDIMRTFTIMTFVMVPLTLITGVFGMNTTPDLIFITSAKDFYFVVGVMLLTGLVMFLFFKLRRWL
jgi:magnesium transporter